MSLTREQVTTMPAGPEMDALVAELVMGLKPCEKWREWADIGPTQGIGCPHEPDECYPDTPYMRAQVGDERGWSYSTDIATAWEVLSKFLDGWIVVIQRDCDVGPCAWYVSISDIGQNRPRRWGNGSDIHASLAICRAALMTVLPPASTNSDHECPPAEGGQR